MGFKGCDETLHEKVRRGGMVGGAVDIKRRVNDDPEVAVFVAQGK